MLILRQISLPRDLLHLSLKRLADTVTVESAVATSISTAWYFSCAVFAPLELVSITAQGCIDEVVSFLKRHYLEDYYTLPS